MARPAKEMGVIEMIKTKKVDDVFERARILIMVKGMTFQDAIADLEAPPKPPLPDHIKDMIRREVG